MKKLSTIILSILLVNSMIYAYSYSAFSVMAGKSTLTINPYSRINNKGSFEQELFISAGLIDKIDLWTSFNIIPDKNKTNASAMIRYDISGKNTILALRVNGNNLSPQLHYIWQNEFLVLQSNIVGEIYREDPKRPSVYGILSVGIFFLDGLADVFCEINPGYYSNRDFNINYCKRNKGFDLDIVPGVSSSVGNCLFSIGCPINNVINKPTISFGFWWSLSK